MPFRDRSFILILGHGRSGTSLCANLLNQHPDLNIGLEINNSKIAEDNFEMHPSEEISLSYSGNKVVINEGMRYEILIECIRKKIWIMHSKFSRLFPIFIKRNLEDTLLSQYRRLGSKFGNEGVFSIPSLTTRYKEVEEILRKLKTEFNHYSIKYHVFDFDQAVVNEMHRKWLFDFVGKEYDPWYSDTFIGKFNYPYQGISCNYAIHSNPNSYREIKDEIKQAISSQHCHPWIGFKGEDYA